MLKWLHRIGIAWQSEARRRRQRVDRRLRAEAADACVAPSPELRRRTISALNDAAHDPAPATVLPRPVAPAYALALFAVCAAGVLAVRLGISERLAPVEVADTPAILAFDTAGFDALIRTRIQEFEGTWETSLRTEARLIADDARNAGEFVLAALPLPTTWSGLTRPGG